MKRREFMAGLGGAAAWPLAARAQQRTKPTIGVFGGPRGRLEEIRRGLADLGFLEGRDVTIELPHCGRPSRAAARACR